MAVQTCTPINSGGFFPLKSGLVIPAAVLVLQDCFTYTKFLGFPYETENFPFKFYKELCWNGDCIEFVDSFGRMDIFTLLILWIQKHGGSPYLQLPSLIFFKDLYFYHASCSLS